MDILDFCAKENIDIKQNVPLREHTTFRIGGPARFFISPVSGDEMIRLVAFLHGEGLNYRLLGRGSNVLACDEGIQDPVIFTGGISSIEVRGNTVTAGCGAFLRDVALRARDASLTGLEFAHGIPGSVGGAVYMNAGAYGGEISGVLSSAVRLFPDGRAERVRAGDLDLGYRSSSFMEDGSFVLSAEFSLEPGERESISAEMKRLAALRSSKQPLEYPSAGSTFKRPEGHFAGALIEQCGLKGTGVGGARVSEKHAGFVINSGDACFDDVIALIEKIKKTVFDNTGVMLEEEIRIWRQ